MARDHAEAAFFARYVEDAVVQERLEGVEYTLDVLAGLDSDAAHPVAAPAAGHRIGGLVQGRHPLAGGPASTRCGTLVRALGMVGPLNFQCFVGPDGRVAFTEINARMAGTAILSQAAGVPLFEGILDLARGREPEALAETLPAAADVPLLGRGVPRPAAGKEA